MKKSLEGVIAPAVLTLVILGAATWGIYLNFFNSAEPEVAPVTQGGNVVQSEDVAEFLSRIEVSREGVISAQDMRTAIAYFRGDVSRNDDEYKPRLNLWTGELSVIEGRPIRDDIPKAREMRGRLANGEFCPIIGGQFIEGDPYSDYFIFCEEDGLFYSYCERGIANYAYDPLVSTVINGISLTRGQKSEVFPTNANGQTYGISTTADSITHYPDLEYGYQSTNGKTGYVRFADMFSPAFGHCEDVKKELNSRGIVGYALPVFESDGVTIIGEFVVAVGYHDPAQLEQIR